MVVSQLYIYPVKSCKGIAVSSWPIGPKGFHYDRQWMVVRAETGVFITQRQIPKMCLIETKLTGPQERLSLSLNAPGMPQIDVGDGSDRCEKTTVEIWKQKVQGIDMGEEVAKWLTEYLSVPARLVMSPPDYQRDLDEAYVKELRQQKETTLNIAYADGYPFLLTSETSLNWLNANLISNQTSSDKIKLDILRFRPNIVVSGIPEPFGEDKWKKIEITSPHKSTPVVLHIVKSCSRCTVPNIDWKSGKRFEEPLKTLREYRMQPLPFDGEDEGPNKTYPMFGQNCVAQLAKGKVSLADEVHVLQKI